MSLYGTGRIILVQDFSHPQTNWGVLSTVSVISHVSHVVFISLAYFNSWAYSVQLDYIVLIWIDVSIYCLWMHFWNISLTEAFYIIFFFKHQGMDRNLWGCCFCTLGKPLQLGWSSVLCSCACMLCSPRKLNWFLNLNSGIFLRDEGIFRLLRIDFCEASQVNWEIFSYQMGQVVPFNCDIFMKVSSTAKLLVLCTAVLKSLRGAQMLYGLWHGKWGMIVCYSEQNTKVWLHLAVIEQCNGNGLSVLYPHGYWKYSTWTVFRTTCFTSKNTLV